MTSATGGVNAGKLLLLALPLAVAVAPIGMAAIYYRRRAVGWVLTGAAIVLTILITAAWWLLFGGDTH